MSKDAAAGDDHNFLLETQLMSPLLGKRRHLQGNRVPHLSSERLINVLVSAAAVKDDLQVKVGVSSPVEEIIKKTRKRRDAGGHLLRPLMRHKDTGPTSCLSPQSD